MIFFLIIADKSNLYNGIVSRKNLHQQQYRQQHHQLRHQKLSVEEGSEAASVSSSSSGLYKSGRHLGSSKTLPTSSSVGGMVVTTTTTTSGAANLASPSLSATSETAVTTSQTTSTLQNQSAGPQQQQQQQQRGLDSRKNSAEEEVSGQGGNLSQFSSADKLEGNSEADENGTASENGNSDSLQKSRIDCRSEELSRLKTKCELLIRMCIGGLLLQMTDQSFKDMEGMRGKRPKSLQDTSES